MKIHDISQKVFGCQVYPGDRKPQMFEDTRMSRGDTYNLSSFEMCAHNGTHIDAPFHFLNDGDTVERLPLEKTVGFCFVVEQNEDISGELVHQMLCRARETNAESAKRVLIKGSGVVTVEAAQFFTESGIYLIGTEAQSVGDAKAPAAVHKILLGAGAVLLEGICLEDVSEGVYFLSAAPINLNGCDGAPCRAILIECPKNLAACNNFAE